MFVFGLFGFTPAIIKLNASDGFFSKAEYVVELTAPGHQKHTTVIGSNIDGWYFGNIFLGGLIGMLIIDPATGAMWRIDTDEVSAV